MEKKQKKTMEQIEGKNRSPKSGRDRPPQCSGLPATTFSGNLKSFTKDILIAPKWYYRNGFQMFYLQYENFSGTLLNFTTAIEYNPWKHVGFGLGLDALRMDLEADGKDYPGIDLRGNIEFDYTGVMLYGRFFF